MSGHDLSAPRAHQVTAADGTLLHATDYLLPAAQARGAVVIMHGIGEHSGRYRHVAAFFNRCGLSVRIYDHRGHGRSQGGRGDVVTDLSIVQDAEIVVDDFASQFADPPFLMGHSMGGLFAAHFALSRRSPLRGLILSSPALAVSLSSIEKAALRFMHAVLPRVGVPNGLDAHKLSRDLAVVHAYRSDPLVHNKISARLLQAILASIAYCEKHAASLSVPTLMVAAGDDHLVNAEGSKRFAAAAPSDQLEFHLYPAFYHEVLNEPDAATVFADIEAWLEKQKAR